MIVIIPCSIRYENGYENGRSEATRQHTKQKLKNIELVVTNLSKQVLLSPIASPPPILMVVSAKHLSHLSPKMSSALVATAAAAESFVVVAILKVRPFSRRESVCVFVQLTLWMPSVVKSQVGLGPSRVRPGLGQAF